MARTRIVATLGPASSTEERIAALIDAGVAVFRLNLSHGTRTEHAGRITAIRRVAGTRPTAILLDLAARSSASTAPCAAVPATSWSCPCRQPSARVTRCCWPTASCSSR